MCTQRTLVDVYQDKKNLGVIRNNMHLASVFDTIANLNISVCSIKHKRYIKLIRELFSKGLFRKYVHGRRKIDT